jgi:hypothetical protein
MSFAMCPDGGPNRIVRFVNHGVLPVASMVAALDTRTNVLRVDRELFAQLTREQQSLVMKTRDAYVEATTLSGNAPVFA